jgi:radical SAM protein with 4Fe4S-binding SPASM domain
MKNLRVDLWMVDFVFNSGEEHPCFLPNSYLQFQSALFESATKIALQHFREQPSFDLVIPDFYDSIAIALNIKRDFSVDSKVFANERTLTVRHNAMVSFSPHLPHTFGNIFSETISSITSRSAWQRLQNLRVKNLSPQCLQCKLMKQCGGGNRAAAWIATNKINLAHRFNCSLQKFQSMHLEPVLKGTVRGSLTQALS